jgi:hypothetical protein
MVLRRTIRSIVRPANIYGNAGDQVTLVSDHDEVLIVEDENKFRFPVKREEVSEEDKPELLPDETPVLNEAPVKNKKNKKAAPQEQKSLF